jgi:deazaflavin-dependent oxidoreductase (nitroreductase family)
MGKLANQFVAAVLRSRLHRLLSGSLALLTVRGRRSGKEHTFPVQYAREGDRVYVYPAGHERKQWWRNLLDPSPVRVRIAGEDTEGVGRTLLSSEDPEGVAAGTRAYLARFPRLSGVVDGDMIVRIDLRP